jgi:hypothetical protein
MSVHFDVSVVEPSTALTILRRDYFKERLLLELPTTEDRQLQVEVSAFGFLQVGGPLN